LAKTCYTGKQPLKDSLETIKWQGFEQEDGLIGFDALKQQPSPTMRLRQAELMILIRCSKEGEICQNDNLVQILARKRNLNMEPSQKGILWWLHNY
jgi:hypothetical protein